MTTIYLLSKPEYAAFQSLLTTFFNAFPPDLAVFLCYDSS